MKRAASQHLRSQLSAHPGTIPSLGTTGQGGNQGDPGTDTESWCAWASIPVRHEPATRACPLVRTPIGGDMSCPCINSTALSRHAWQADWAGLPLGMILRATTGWLGSTGVAGNEVDIEASGRLGMCAPSAQTVVRLSGKTICVSEVRFWWRGETKNQTAVPDSNGVAVTGPITRRGCVQATRQRGTSHAGNRR
jgi:hypothetical protein